MLPKEYDSPIPKDTILWFQEVQFCDLKASTKLHSSDKKQFSDFKKKVSQLMSRTNYRISYSSTEKHISLIFSLKLFISKIKFCRMQEMNSKSKFQDLLDSTMFSHLKIEGSPATRSKEWTQYPILSAEKHSSPSTAHR